MDGSGKINVLSIGNDLKWTNDISYFMGMYASGFAGVTKFAFLCETLKLTLILIIKQTER
jgi:hypothetical protein